MILLVDDDEDILEMMKVILEGEGFSVNTATNGKEALEKIKLVKYSAVITDYVMPLMRGDEMAKQIRVSQPYVGLILITGFKQGLNPSIISLFDTVLEKPVNPGQILASLNEIMGTQKIVDSQVVAAL